MLTFDANSRFVARIATAHGERANREESGGERSRR
jgi:hypothetical protein